MSESDEGKSGEPGTAIEVAVGADGATLKVSEETASKLGRAFRAVFPRWSARTTKANAEANAHARVVDAHSQRVADLLMGKVETPRPIDALLLSQALSLDLDRMTNASATMALAAQLIDQRFRPTGALPSATDAHEAPPEWYARWLRDAEDVSTESLRDLYARLLAGQIARPAAFSMRTLSVLRDLDTDTAHLFAAMRPRVFMDGALPSPPHAPPWALRPEISADGMRALRDAGLGSSVTGDECHLVMTATTDRKHFELDLALAPGTFRIRIPNDDWASVEGTLLVERLTLAGRELMALMAPMELSWYAPLVRWVGESLSDAIDLRSSDLEVEFFETPNSLPVLFTEEVRKVAPVV